MHNTPLAGSIASALLAANPSTGMFARFGRYFLSACLCAAALALTAGCAATGGNASESGGNVLLEETFDNDLEGMWVEGGYKTWVENGSLYINADGSDGKPASGVATVWFAQMMPADIQIEFDAEVISSSIEANNINFFFNYSDPSGRPLYETRAERASGAYSLYHNLNGYIVTFLNDRNVEGGVGRVRLRRCPGFNLMEQYLGGRCDAGIVYHCRIVNKGGKLSFYVNGELLASAEDPEPLGEGLIGIRTFKTFLRIDNLRVTQL